ncbi:hypothetical protein [Brevundimonas sp.]|uniref:hypothetical protein n=1 Tax=Brevundimonas sp. TaxID=1871086 RepID=UPI002AB9637E|nr:hypothetical protein [Brevundimonas sp.]MDZ4364416.1 hypothetical protein [Brevundimonas sp.]
MAGQTAHRARHRRLTLIAVSAVAHVAVLGVLSLRTFGLPVVRNIDPPPIYLDIEPRPLLPGETVRTPRPPAAPPRLSETQPERTADARQTTPALDREDEQNPDTPVGRPSDRAPGAPAPSPGLDDGWRVAPGGTRESVGRSLRGSVVGCDMRNGRMSPAEQAICDERFNADAGRAAPITGSGDAERDARFAREGAGRVARYEARRRPLSGGTGVVGPSDGVGSNFGTGTSGAHLDPSFQPDSNENVRTRRDGPRASGTPLTPGGTSPRERR